MCQWFAPSRLVITLERDGPGAFSMEEIREIAIRGRDGRVTGLKLPLKSVLIANHQVRICPLCFHLHLTTPLRSMQTGGMRGA